MVWMQPLISLAAILFTAYVVSRMFPHSTAITLEAAKENYHRFSPDAVQSEALISENGQSALVMTTTPETELGVLTVLGDKIVCRTLLTADSLNWQLDTDTITLHHSDYTQPAVTFEFSADNAKKAKQVIAKLTLTKEQANV